MRLIKCNGNNVIVIFFVFAGLDKSFSVSQIPVLNVQGVVADCSDQLNQAHAPLPITNSSG